MTTPGQARTDMIDAAGRRVQRRLPQLTAVAEREGGQRQPVADGRDPAAHRHVRLPAGGHGARAAGQPRARQR